MQAADSQQIIAAEKLIDVVIGQPIEVYESFLEAVKQINLSVFEMIANSAFQGRFCLTSFKRS